MKYAPESAHFAREVRDLLHGYPVIAQAPLPVESGTRNARVVIVDRQAEISDKGRGLAEKRQIDRFVCAVHCYGDKEWMWGLYCHTFEEALGHFVERIGRRYTLPMPPSQEG